MYELTKTSGDERIYVPEKLFNDQTTLTFIGKNTKCHGEVLNKNILGLLENFSSPSLAGIPTNTTFDLSKAIQGQTWFDTSSGNLNFFNESWNGIFNKHNVIGQMGIISDGEKIPIPPSFTIDDCYVIVSPMVLNGNGSIASLSCYVDVDLTVRVNYGVENVQGSINGLATYLVLCIKG